VPVAAKADIIELAVVQGREVSSRAVAVMPQHEREKHTLAEALPGGFADKGEDVKNVLHGRTMPPGERSALRRQPKRLLECNQTITG